MVAPLVGKHRLEGVGLGMDPGPAEVVIAVGSVDLVEAVGVADLEGEEGEGPAKQIDRWDQGTELSTSASAGLILASSDCTGGQKSRQI